MEEKSNRAPDTDEHEMRAIQVPLKSITKADIKAIVFDSVQEGLEEYDPIELYIFWKQIEALAKQALELLNQRAFENAGNRFFGQNQGEVLGHEVRLTWPKRWTYSEDVDLLKERQKKELEALQLTEEANGKATLEQKLGQITVKLKTK